jgi:hypothetical protein
MVLANTEVTPEQLYSMRYQELQLTPSSQVIHLLGIQNQPPTNKLITETNITDFKLLW